MPDMEIGLSYPIGTTLPDSGPGFNISDADWDVQVIREHYEAECFVTRWKVSGMLQEDALWLVAR